jgi:hypothetical protein
MGNCDIFIKTYYKDFVWLEWCLKSIKKFASGFRKIIIVSDAGMTIPASFSDIIPFTIFYVPLPNKRPSYVEHGVGYLWQQYIKLSWYNYSDADEVLILDSDEMLTVPTTPDSFKTGGKYNWFYRDWDLSCSGICWKDSTEMMLESVSPYDAMIITGFILQKETTIALKNRMCSLQEVNDIWDIVTKRNIRTFSEFNIFGNFVFLFGRKEYNCIINEDLSNTINWTIKKDWSWGGITVDNITERQSILDSV